MATFDSIKSQLSNLAIKVDIVKAELDEILASIPVDPISLPPVFPKISISDVSIDEAALQVSLVASLDKPWNNPVTFKVNTVDDTAVAGNDYIALVNQLITFPVGVTQVNIVVNIINDDVPESSKTFNVVLSDPTEATLLDATAVVTITDTDLLPVLNLTGVTANEDTGSAIVTASLSRVYSKPVSFVLTTADGTAVAGTDYQSVNTTITIPAGQLSANTAITLINDNTPETTETFVVSASNLINATISIPSVTVTIVDTDTLSGDPLAEVKAIVASMQPGEFRKVAKNNYMDVAPSMAETTWAVQGPLAVVGSWSTMALGQDMIFLQGGGHGDYGGNEVYKFSFKTLTWTRETNPSPLTTLGSGKFAVADGSNAPISYHGYDGIEYIPTLGKFAIFPSASYQSGNNYDNFTYLYDPVAKTWEKKSAIGLNTNPDNGVMFWPATNKILYANYNGLIAYNIATDTWSNVQNWESQASGRTGIYDPVKNYFIQLGGENQKLTYWPLDKFNLGNGEFGIRRTKPVLVGDTGWQNNSGLDYYPINNKTYIWNGGPDVWILDSSNWNVVKTTGFGIVGTSPNTGIYGKWRYYAALGVFVGIRLYNEGVLLYKPSNP